MFKQDMHVYETVDACSYVCMYACLHVCMLQVALVRYGWTESCKRTHALPFCFRADEKSLTEGRQSRLRFRRRRTQAGRDAVSRLSDGTGQEKARSPLLVGTPDRQKMARSPSLAGKPEGD